MKNSKLHIGLITLTDMDTAFDLGNALIDAGHEVTYYFSKHSLIRTDTPPEKFLAELEKRNIITDFDQIRLYEFPRMRDPRSLFTILNIRNQMRADKIDILHILAGPSEPWLAVLAKFLKNIPVMTTLIVPKANLNDPLAKYVEPINKMLIAWSDKVVVNCENLVEPLKAQYSRNGAKIIHLPLGARTTSNKWLNEDQSADEHSILFFGRSDPHKGLEYLIQAQPKISQAVPDARFIIASHGDNLTHCLNLIEDQDAFEIQSGYIIPEQMAELFNRCSVVALPYLTASTSGVLLTAYQFGKPVVFSQVGCLHEYAKDQITGLVIPTKDSEALADAIIQLLQDKELRTTLGTNAKNWIKAHQKDFAYAMTSEYLKTIEQHQAPH